MDDLKVVKINKESFSFEVRSYAVDHGDNLLDSIMHIAQKNNIEMDVIPRLLTKELKELLESQMVQMKLVKKTKDDDNRLDFEVKTKFSRIGSNNS